MRRVAIDLDHHRPAPIGQEVPLRRLSHTAFDLEPELKEGRGGLRDVHALRWAAAGSNDIDPASIGMMEAHGKAAKYEASGIAYKLGE